MNTVNTLHEGAVTLSSKLERFMHNKPLQAWVHYQQGDEAKALAYWEEAAQSDDDEGLRARRSLAVHYHAFAYQQEIDGRREDAISTWKKALTLWAAIFASRSFRVQLPVLSTVKEDERLDHAALDGMIAVLAECVLAPSEALIYQAVEAEAWRHAGHHVELLRTSGFSETLCKPLLDRIVHRVCPIRHSSIDHITFDEHGSQGQRKRADFALKCFPERVNGLLSRVELAVWRGKKAAQTQEDTKGAWDDIEALDQQGLLQQLDDWATDDATIVFHARTRLQEIAQTACEVRLARHNVLWDSYREAIESLQRSRTLRCVEEALERAERLVDRKQEGGLRRCETLCEKYGEVPQLDRLREDYASIKKAIEKTIRQLRTERAHRRRYR